MAGAIVSFDWPTFVSLFPEFSGIGAATGNAYFGMAGMIFANDGSGPESNPTNQLLLMNILTAHFAQLFSGQNGQNPSPLVGRIESAAEGSVNVSVQNDYPPGTVQWFQQTKYGSTFWIMTSIYRRFKWVAPIVRPADFSRFLPR